MARVLISGGAGFIGTHASIVLLENGHDLVVIDSFVNSSPIALQRVKEITGLNELKAQQRLKVVEGDIRDKAALQKIFTDANNDGKIIDAVIHFAGLKSVKDSIKSPLNYWDVNVNGSCCLLSAMQENKCRTLIFSSSATLYGKPKSVPISETAAIDPINAYGNTKAAIEKMLADISTADSDWRIACLRYFNPIGAHASGLIGEDPRGTPNNLLPIINQVAIGHQKVLKIYGNKWPTKDGTCIRDYIHVMDLAEGHAAALDSLLQKEHQFLTVNLGTGKGHSVLEVVNSFEIATGKKIPFELSTPRYGDVGITIADPTKAKNLLGWEAKRSLVESCKDAWTWQTSNMNGYQQ